jgi:hypothetical protein
MSDGIDFANDVGQPRTHMTLRLIAQDPSVLGEDQQILTAQVRVPWSRTEVGPRGARLHVVDYDTATGTPSNRRLFIDMNPLPGRPDGAAVDADGCYWICGNDAGLVHRFTPAGKLDRSLAVPVKKPAMCAFGGAGLDTLFVTSIRPEGVDLSDQPLAGGVFALRPGVRGLPETACLY